MKKLFTEGKAKKVVEFKQEELEVARAVLAALNDKSVEVKVAVNSNEEENPKMKRSKREKHERLNDKVCGQFTQSEGEMVREFAQRNEMSAAACIRAATMEYIANHAA